MKQEGIKGILKLICYVIVTIMIFFIFISSTGMDKLIIIPFGIAGVSAIGMEVSRMLYNNKLSAIFKKVFLSIFLIYYFGILIYIIIENIKNGNSQVNIIYGMLMLFGGYITYKYILKKE